MHVKKPLPLTELQNPGCKTTLMDDQLKMPKIAVIAEKPGHRMKMRSDKTITEKCRREKLWKNLISLDVTCV